MLLVVVGLMVLVWMVVAVVVVLLVLLGELVRGLLADSEPLGRRLTLCRPQSRPQSQSTTSWWQQCVS